MVGEKVTIEAIKGGTYEGDKGNIEVIGKAASNLNDSTSASLSNVTKSNAG